MKLTIQQLNELVSELLVFEPSLKGREAELTEMITRLIDAKPEIMFDDSFRVRLREEILQLAKERSIPGFKSNIILNLNHMLNLNKVSYAVAGAAILILLIVPAVILLQTPRLPGSGNKIAFESKITKAGENAFGTLRSTNDLKTPSMIARPQGGGGGGSEIQPIGLGGGGGGSATADSAKLGFMPPYEVINYRYIYKGNELSALADKLDVLKQVKGAQTNVNMSDLISGLNFGLSDLGSFSNLALQNISLVQKGDNGYIVSIMPEEGAISISQNWATWPQAKCANDTLCIETQRVKAEEIPADSELISIADAFLAEHNIDKSVYGEPVISPGYNFRVMYEAAADKANFYFPESIDVVYPFMIDGKFVYDEWNGTKQGMMVSVQVKQKKVSNLYNLTTQNYQASAYEMETDTKKILAYAEQGGMNSAQYDAGVRKVELALADPELVYIKYYSYKDGINEELLVPALYFPITELPKDANFYRKGVVVPLAKTVLEERQSQVVMPYGQGGDTPAGAAETGSAGSVEAVPSKVVPLIEPRK